MIHNSFADFMGAGIAAAMLGTICTIPAHIMEETRGRKAALKAIFIPQAILIIASLIYSAYWNDYTAFKVVLVVVTVLAFFIGFYCGSESFHEFLDSLKAKRQPETPNPKRLAFAGGLFGPESKTAPLLGHIDGKPFNYAGERHLCTFAPNGSGKFSTVQAPVLMTLERPIFCIDPKGQAAAVTARRRREMGHKVITLNPFGLHGLPRHRFNPVASLNAAAPSFVADVARLVDGLIDQSGKESPHWSNSARDLFTWLIMWTVIHEGEKNLSTVRDLLCLPERYFCDVAEKAAQDDYPPLRNKAAAFVGNKTASGFAELSGELRGVISTAKAETRIFDDPAIRESLGGSDFDFAELKKGKASVYVVLPADFLGSHAKWLRVVVMSALSSMYRNPEGERVLFLLDEAFSLGYMSDLEKAAGLVRGYRVQLWLFFQDYSQIHGLYGERSETFLANAGITQVFTANDPSTAAYFSKRSGEKTVWRETQGKDSSSYAEMKEPLFSTYDILGLPENQQLIFKDGMGAAILANKTPDYFKPGSGFAGMYDVDPYHKPKTAEARPGATGAGDMAEAPA